MIKSRTVGKLISITIIFMLCLVTLSPLDVSIAHAVKYEAGEDPSFIEAPTSASLDRPTVSTFSSQSKSDYSYVSHVFTVADVIFFSYVDGTMLAVYDSSGNLIWDNGGNPLDKGGHAYVSVPQGVYTACGSEKFAVLSGDPITRYVVGYYAMDQNGFGTSTELYTWVPQLYGHCSFIVFAYEDNTQVSVDDTDTATNIATFTLSKGQHWQIETLQSEWLHITANHPVSALTCYDQGYLVPSANGRWSGTEFYTYVSDIQSWPEDLTVVSYIDGTSVTIKDSNAGSVVWSGELDEGQAHVESFPSGANRFFTITSSESVTVAVQPWVAITSDYHQGLYVGDSTGTRLGTDLIGSTLDGGYLYVLAYKDSTTVVVSNSRTGAFVKSYTLNDGDYVEANPGNGLWRIMSNYPVSAYSGFGQWNAEFAPIEFRASTPVKVEISTEKMRYATNELVTIRAKVTDANGNPLHPLQEGNFKISVDGHDVVIEGFERISCVDYTLEIHSPSVVGTHSIVVTATVANGKGSDTAEIEVYAIGSVSLVVGGNRLTQYENSADTPIYYRADSSVYPIFLIDVEVNGATLQEIRNDIWVYAEIQDYTGVKGPIKERAVYDPITSKFKAQWKHGPDTCPVGEYDTTVKVEDSNKGSLASSEEKSFYLIFKPPAGYEDFVSVTHSTEIRSSWNVWKYNLHQFQYRNWKPTLDEITGKISADDAAQTLLLFAHGIDESYYGYWHMDDDETLQVNDPTHPSSGDFIYGSFGCLKNYASWPWWLSQNAWWYDVDTFQDSSFNPENYNLQTNRPTGVCADYAPLLVSNLASAGIPAREVAGYFAKDGGHAVTEVYYDGQWHHYDPTWNMFDVPHIYSMVGDYWTQYLTRDNSPDSSQTVDRKDFYNYLAETTDIKFDKTDYDYPDWVTATLTIKNTGHVDILTAHLHIKIYDHPTIARLGVDHLISDTKIDSGATGNISPILAVGQSFTVSCTYKLPDYGLLNGFYELVGDRYLLSVIDYYNDAADNAHSIYTVSKAEKEVPGLCSEWCPQISVDSLPIELSPEAMTSFYFDEIKNESTESFTRPLNAYVTVEHDTKYSAQYTREKWYISNPNSDVHEYGLTIPLIGVGDAVYIPEYGTVTNNGTMDVSTDCVIIYNTTVGTNGFVDIYTFSTNMTLKNVTIFDGVVEVIGVQNCTLAQESGESFIVYLSTRGGHGWGLTEIYGDFAQEIVGDGDTLTQFSVEGENEQIFYYKVGDIVYVNVTIFNNGIVSETKNLTLAITEAGVWNTENVIYNATRTVSVIARSEATVTFQYQIPDDPQFGKHRIIVNCNADVATTIFAVQDPFIVEFGLPASVAQAQEFNVNVTITNALDRALSGINTTIDLPNDFSTLENLTKSIGTLLSGESVEVSWHLVATDFEYGYEPIAVCVCSAEGINDVAASSLTVLRLPDLKIFSSAPSEAQAGVPFEFSVNITNQGDLSLQSVSVNLSLPENVVASEFLTEYIGDLAGGETKSVSWTITSMLESDFWIVVNASDLDGTHSAETTELINIVKPEIELNVLNPVEVILDQEFNITAEIKNTGDLAATNVKIYLALPFKLSTMDPTEVNIAHLSPGQTETVEWTMQSIAPGYADITVNASASNISITRGIVITHFPLSVKTDEKTYLRGQNVIMTTTATNENPEVSYVDLSVNLTVDGPSSQDSYSMPIDFISNLETRNFALTWNSTGRPFGNYVVKTKLLENTMVLNETTAQFTLSAVIHDVAVANVKTSKDGCTPMPTVGNDSFVKVNVTVFNGGDFTETFNVTLYANSTVVGTQTVSGLAVYAQAVLTYTWNVAGWAHGDYVISAYAVPVLEETNTADNTYTGSVIRVVILGDINGDGTVDIFDAILLAGAYNSVPTLPNWSPNADLNGSEMVDIFDAIILANHYGQTLPRF